MADNTAIPDLKSKERERKKGGALLPGSGGTGSGFTGALGGEGAGALGEAGAGGFSTLGARAGGSEFLAMMERVFGKSVAALIPKVLTITMVACLGYGAYSVGIALRAFKSEKGASAGPKPFSSKPAPQVRSDGLGLPGSDQGRSSLGMITGSLDGKTQAERDAEAAAAKAAAEKAAAAQAKADAAPPEQPNATAGPAGVDPRVMAAAAAAKAVPGDGVKGGGKGFGAFSNALGGGGGLANFGISQGVAGANKLGGSQALSNPARASRTGSSLASAINPGRGNARRQLGKAVQLSNAATRSSVPETMAQNAQNAFQTPTGGGSAITGDGAKAGGVGGGTTSPSGNPVSNGGGGGGGNPSFSNGGSASVPDDCGALFPDGGYISGNSGGCVCPPGMDGDGTKCSSVHSTNASPDQMLIDWAKKLMMLASVLLLAAMLFGMMAKSAFPPTAATLYAIAKYLAYAAMAVAAIVTLLGISIMMMGGRSFVNGLLYTLMGGITTYLAYKAAEHYDAESAKADNIAKNAAKDLKGDMPKDQAGWKAYEDAHPNAGAHPPSADAPASGGNSSTTTTTTTTNADGSTTTHTVSDTTVTTPKPATPAPDPGAGTPGTSTPGTSTPGASTPGGAPSAPPAYSNNGFMEGPGGPGSAPDLPGYPGATFTSSTGTTYAWQNGMWVKTGTGLFGGGFGP